MALTQQQLDSFHRFASEKIQNGGQDMSVSELAELWQLATSSPDVDEAIRTGIAEADAKLGRTASDFEEDMRNKHNIPVDA